MAVILARAVHWFCEILIFLLVLRALMSWFAGSGSSPVTSIYRFAVELTEPIVAPIRKAMSRFNTGALDFSVLVAFLLIEVVESLVMRLIFLIF
jgi:YggT family protein